VEVIPGSSLGPGFELQSAAHYDATSWVSFNALVAHAEKERGFRRNNWEIGTTLKWHDVLFDLKYGGTDTPRRNCYFTNWCQTGFSATITYQFGWVL
jgi:hypothetical protein